MEEENIKVEIPPIAIPGPEEITTADQLKQFYNSEKWKEVAKSFEKTFEEVKKMLIPIIKAASEAAIKYRDMFMRIYCADPEIKKCYGIYKRTRKKRIRKKQMTRIYKKIRRYVEDEENNSRNKTTKI